MVKPSLPKDLFPKSEITSPKIKAKISTQTFLKIKEIKDGVVILKSGALRGIILTSSINFDLLSEEEQNAKLYAFQELLNALDFPIQIIIQSRKLNINRYLDRVKELERTQENELLRVQISEYAEYIRSLVELANITTKHFYLVVPYSGPGVETKQSFTEKFTSFLKPAAKVEVERETFERAKEALNIRMNQILEGLSGMGLRAASLDTQEIVELFYNFYNPDEYETEILADLDLLNLQRK